MKKSSSVSKPLPHSPPAEPAAPPKLFPIVGVGASAGGLEAFSELLRELPVKTGMAFVLVQHLDPKHSSGLTELLARTTKVPVQEVSDGMQVQPDQIYIIPPNTCLTIKNGVLQLAERVLSHGLNLPINHFFQSLAEERGKLAIGVILSGTASDGTEGCQAIKAAGGITFAQDEASAKHSGMPHNAAAAGCIDLILPPNQIARELARMAKHPYLVRTTPREEPLDASADGWKRCSPFCGRTPG